MVGTAGTVGEGTARGFANGRDGRPGLSRRGTRRLVAAALAASVCAGLLAGCVRETPDDQRYITDSAGRALILHGANVASASKSSPDHLPPHNEVDIARMGDDWGMNMARFLLQWSQLEPEPGVYDEAYLDAVAERVGWFGAHGIGVVLDMHQDIWGPAAGGNGAPAWATRTDGIGLLPLGGMWELQYLQPAVARAFDHFWYDADLRARYAAAWRHVAERFAADDRVIGYDIMNEPWGGSHQAGFEAGPLSGMYQEVTDKIRRSDADHWIFVEPQSFGVNQGLASQLRRIEDPREGEDRIVYFPHFYSVEQDIFGGYSGQTTFVDIWSTNRTREQERFGSPTVIGEFGMAAAMKGWEPYLDAILQMADQSTSGWAYWSYEITDPGDPATWGLSDHEGDETPQVDHLVRTYARAVAGHPTAMSFDPGTGVFSLTFTETGVDAPSEIFVPAGRRYGGGWVVECSDDDGTWTSTWDPDRQILSVSTNRSQASHTIEIHPM